MSINHHHESLDVPESFFLDREMGRGVAGWLAMDSCICDITVCGCFVGNINLGGQSVRVALRT